MKIVPYLFLLLVFLSFGLLIPFLGYYWDDWETILVIKRFGLSSIWDYFSGHRPLAGWTYLLATPILGIRPVGWHIFSLVLRWATVVAMWWSFGLAWPERRSELAAACMLFAVYPLFVQQPIAVSYHQHWLAYLLFFLSVGFMVQATQQPHRYYCWIMAGIIAEALHLVTLEYFMGVELLRPLILIILAGRLVDDKKKRITTILKGWLPFLATLVFFIVIRLVLSSRLEEDPNRPTLLFNFLTKPGPALLRFIQIAGQDLIYILYTCWNKTLQPTLFDLKQPFILFTWGMVLVVFILADFSLKRLFQIEKNAKGPKNKWMFELGAVGVASLFLGVIPIWLTDRQASATGLYSDRFAMAAMFGASFLYLWWIEWISSSSRKKSIILAILIAMPVGLHLRTANSYRWSWTFQQRFYWQLYWRAPSIKPATVLLADTELFNYVFPTFSLNLLYDQPPSPKEPGYLFYYIDHGFNPKQENWQNGETLRLDYRNFDYSVPGKNALVLFYKPSSANANCLWVLGPRDSEDPYLPDSTRSALPLSDFSLIGDHQDDMVYPNEKIFGKEPEHTWCYYYQKASLARQIEDWKTIVELADEAREKGYSLQTSQANSPHEWLPFIEAYAHLGDLEKAGEITMSGYRVDQNYRQVLCNLWGEINLYVGQDYLNKAKILEIEDQLSCNQ